MRVWSPDVRWQELLGCTLATIFTYDLLPGFVILKQLGLGEVNYAGSGAGPISKDTLSFFNSYKLNILNIFGQSESCGMGTSWLSQSFRLDKLGSIGLTSPGMELKIQDPEDKSTVAQGEKGEIMLRGRAVMLGYMNKPEKSATTIDEDGWLATGDQARPQIPGRFVERLPITRFDQAGLCECHVASLVLAANFHTSVVKYGRSLCRARSTRTAGCS